MTTNPTPTPKGRQEYQNGPESGRDPMTAADLDAIRARLDAATRDRWMRRGNTIMTIGECVAAAFAGADAELIAHAPADLAALLAEVARLTAERDAYKRAKAENDERFMIERDEARAERDAARTALAAVTRVLTDWGAIRTDDATGIDAGEDLAETIRELGAWRLVRDLRNVFAKHAEEDA